MPPISGYLLLSLLICVSISSSIAFSDPVIDSFLHCLSYHTSPYTNISQIVFLHDTPSYSSLLGSSLQNLRAAPSAKRKPLLIVSPANELHIQASVICCRNQSLQLRVRSGGHDYEGLSYRSLEAINFVLIDLGSFRSVDIDIKHRVAWVQAGATLGDLYYNIGNKSSVYGFPAGFCPTIGVGGHISGGGLGALGRKYGLSADNVLDAKLVDANGRLLDKRSMGKDLFWAIRGGGGASFGVIVSWKLKLVPVTNPVSVFSIHKSEQQGAIELVNRWQWIAPKFSNDLFLMVTLVPEPNATVGAVFQSFFLGKCTTLLHRVRQSFPELGMQASDCLEMSWVQSTLYFAGFNNVAPLQSLMDRSLFPKSYSKFKSDYLQKQIPWEGLRGIRTRLSEGVGFMQIYPIGGRLGKISDSELPYPYRRGYLFILQYITVWEDGSNATLAKNLDWIRGLYSDIAPFVSMNPRATYLNFRDLDLGMNEGGGTTYSKAKKAWGEKYFNHNFKRLALVKGQVDPHNFFRNEQSVPPLLH